MKKAKLEIEGFGERILTELDFYNECEKRGWEVSERYLLSLEGITFWIAGRVVITLNKELRGNTRLFTMWHEFAHALLHAPATPVGAAFAGLDQYYNRKQEAEADFIAQIAAFNRTQ